MKTHTACALLLAFSAACSDATPSRDLSATSTAGAGATAATASDGAGGATASASGGAAPCTPPAELPELPPLGQRRCANLPAGASSDPAAKGPFPVGVRTIDLSDPLRPGRTLTTEIWYPADASVAGQDGAAYSVELSDVAAMMGVDLPFSLGAVELVKTDAVRDAPRAPADPAAGLVVYSHGFRGIRFQSTFLTVYLASHGYVVAAPDHQGNTIFDGSATPEQSAKDRVEDFSFVTREMVVRAADPGDFFAGAFDVRRIAWTGHSFGASMSILAGSVDNREILTVPLAPAFDDRMALVYNPPSYDLRAALFVVGGTADTTTPPENQQLAFDRTVAPRYRVALDQAKHMDFTDVCANDFLRLIPPIGDGCGPDTKNMQATVRALVTGAMHRHLRCDPQAEAWVAPAWVSAQPGVAEFEADEGAPLAPLPSDPALLCDVETGDFTTEQKTLPRDEAPSLHVEVSAADPAAPPVLFIHGFGTTGKVFDRQVKALAPRFRVVTLDLRGHGASGKDADAPFGPDGLPATDDDPYRLERYADDVRDAIDALDLSGVVLVGWSSGGQVAMEVARTASPGSVRALVLVDAAPLTVPDPEAHPDYNGGGSLEFARELRLALAATSQDDATWAPLVTNFFAQSPAPSALAPMLDMVVATDPATRRGQIQSVRPDLVDALGAIVQPTLVIQGEQDDAILVEAGRYLAAHLPSATLDIFQRSGHVPFIEEPEHFDAVVEDFLDGLPN